MPPAGYSRAPNRSVSKMNATTAAPTSAPITKVRTKNTCSSRSRRTAVHCFDDALSQALATCGLLLKIVPSIRAFDADGKRWAFTALPASLSVPAFPSDPAPYLQAGKIASSTLVRDVSPPLTAGRGQHRNIRAHYFSREENFQWIHSIFATQVITAPRHFFRQNGTLQG